MTTLPEEAVKEMPEAISDILKNAYLLGFLASAEGYNSEYPFNDDEAEMLTDDNWLKRRDRILSALEPSAARELALEEAAQFIESHIYTSSPDGVRLVPSKRAGLDLHHQTIAAAIRALSSPDHADAGKVERDGWHVEYEVYSEDEWQAASTDLDGALDYAVMYAADGFKNITVQEVRRRTLPSALSEGAE